MALGPINGSSTTYSQTSITSNVGTTSTDITSTDITSTNGNLFSDTTPINTHSLGDLTVADDQQCGVFTETSKLTYTDATGNEQSFICTRKSKDSSPEFVWSVSSAGKLTIEADGWAIVASNGSNTGVSADIAVFGDKNSIQGSGEADIIQVFGDSNRVTGLSGNDTITVEGTNNYVDGGEGNDTLNVNGDKNNISGGHGNDIFNIIGKNNNGRGGNGNDIFNISGSGNTITGDEGNDTISTDATSYKNILSGGAGDDTITVLENKQRASIGDQNRIYGGDGNDSLNIFSSKNIISAGNGNDTVNVTGQQTIISGGAGDDVFSVNATNGTVKIDAGAGNNTVQNTNVANLDISATGDVSLQNSKIAGNLNVNANDIKMTNSTIGGAFTGITAASNNQSATKTLAKAGDSLELTINGNNVKVTAGKDGTSFSYEVITDTQGNKTVKFTGNYLTLNYNNTDGSNFSYNGYGLTLNYQPQAEGSVSFNGAVDITNGKLTLTGEVTDMDSFSYNGKMTMKYQPVTPPTEPNIEQPPSTGSTEPIEPTEPTPLPVDPYLTSGNFGEVTKANDDTIYIPIAAGCNIKPDTDGRYSFNGVNNVFGNGSDAEKSGESVSYSLLAKSLNISTEDIVNSATTTFVQLAVGMSQVTYNGTTYIISLKTTPTPSPKYSSDFNIDKDNYPFYAKIDPIGIGETAFKKCDAIETNNKLSLGSNTNTIEAGNSQFYGTETDQEDNTAISFSTLENALSSAKTGNITFSGGDVVFTIGDNTYKSEIDNNNSNNSVIGNSDPITQARFVLSQALGSLFIMSDNVYARQLADGSVQVSCNGKVYTVKANTFVQAASSGNSETSYSFEIALVEE